MKNEISNTHTQPHIHIFTHLHIYTNSFSIGKDKKENVEIAKSNYNIN